MRHVPCRTRLVVFGLVSTALLALGPQAAVGENALDLRLAPPIGKVLRYHIDNQTDVNYQGLEVTTIADGRVTLSRVEGAPNGNVLFDVVIEKLEASRRQGDNLESQDIGLDGAKASAEVTPRGRLVKIDPVTSMDEQQRRLTENLVNALFVRLPDKPLKSGASWKADMSKPDGSRKGSGEFTLDDVTKKSGRMVARISGPVTVESVAPPYEGKGTYEATLAVDGGTILSAKASMDLKSEDGSSVEQSLELKLVE